jgi:hypothetical protein
MRGKMTWDLSMTAIPQIRMTNDEIRRNTEARMTNPAIAHPSALRHSGFGFLSSFDFGELSRAVIRHLSFDNLCPRSRTNAA